MQAEGEHRPPGRRVTQGVPGQQASLQRFQTLHGWQVRLCGELRGQPGVPRDRLGRLRDVVVPNPWLAPAAVPYVVITAIAGRSSASTRPRIHSTGGASATVARRGG